jgi:hypothetical protein
MSIDEDDRDVFAAVLDTLVYITCQSGFWRDAEIVNASEVFCVAKAPRHQADIRGPGTLDLIALWPFGGRLHIGDPPSLSGHSR